MTTTALDRAYSKAQRLERELREARAKERRVRLIHIHDGPRGSWCGHCKFLWPCPTIAALDQDGDEPVLPPLSSDAAIAHLKDLSDLLTEDEWRELNDDLAQIARLRREAEAASRDVTLP